MANPIRKLVQLVLDRRAAAKTEADAKKALGGVSKAMGALKRAALAVGASMVAAFSIRAVVRFGKAAIKVASEAEAIWERLGQAVSNIGLNMAEVRPEIDAFARAMQDATTVGDEDFAATLTELITISGDYERSIANVGVVADLAAAKQLDLRTAAQLVGRAMIGETSTLKRYGVIVEEGADAIAVLRKQFRGFAESEARTMSGRLKQLSNEWGDFQQAVGDALMVAGGGTETIQTLTTSLMVLSQWVTENARVFEGLGEALTSLMPSLEGLLNIYAKITRAASMAANAQLAFLEFTHTATDSLRQRTQALNDYADSLDDLVAKMQEAERRRVLGIELPPPLLPTPGARPTVPGAPGAGGGDAEEEAADLLAIWREFPEVMLSINAEMTKAANMKEGWAALNSEMEMSAENAAKLEEALKKAGKAGEIGQTEIALMGVAADAAGTLIAGAFGGNVGQLARWKAEQNAIMAAEQLAMGVASTLIPGLQGKAAGHFAAAKLFGGVAAGWAALAGATGGFSGGGGAAGGGGAGSPSDTGGAASERAAVAGEEVHIYFVGPGFSAVNPEVQEIVYGAQQNAQERFGPNATIKLHRRAR